MCFLFSLFSNQLQREDRQKNRINGGKKKRKTEERQIWPKMQRGRQTEPVREEKPKPQGPPHSDQHRHVCDRPKNPTETLQLPNSQNRYIFAKFMIWQSSCIFHTISMRSCIHLVQRADCHFLLEAHTLHWPYVLCQTDTLSPTFSKRVSWRMGLQPLCWFSSVCACVYNVSLYWTTDKASVITGYFLHLVLPSSPLRVHALSSDSRSVPAWFVRSLHCLVQLRCFLKHLFFF